MTRALLEFAFALIAAIGVFGTAALLASVQTTGYCAVSAPRLSLLLSCPLVGLVATVTLIALPAVGATTTVSAATFTYDAPTISRVDVHASGAADAESAQLRGSREGFASPPVQAREASTTQLALINATNSGSRGLSNLGGIIEETGTNAAGGRIFTSTGAISQNDFRGLVQAGLMRGDDVHILTGAHGLPNGSIVVDAGLLADDVRAFGSLPGVHIYDLPSMTPAGVQAVLNGPGTIIGGFCDSGACLRPGG